MALIKQKVEMPLSQGIDTKKDDKQEPFGALAVLENAIFETPNKARKRNGYDIFTNINALNQIVSNIEAITDFEDELCLYTDKKFLSYSESNKKWIEKGISETVFPTSESVIKNNYSQESIDSINLEGVSLFVWEDSRGGVRYSIMDDKTENFLIADNEISSTGEKPKIANIFNFAYITYIDGNELKYRRINALNPTAALESEVSVVTDVNTTYKIFDTTTISNRVYIAYSSTENDGNLKILYIDSSEALSSVISETNETISNALSIIGDSASRVVVSYATTNEVKTVVYNLSLGTKLVAITTIETIEGVKNVSNAEFNNKYYIYYEIGSENVRDNFIKRNSLDLSATIGTPENYMRSLGLSAKLFTYNNDLYCSTIHFSPLQSTYFLIDFDKNIVAKISPNTAGEVLNTGSLPKVTNITEDSFLFSSQIKGNLVSTGDSDNIANARLGVNKTILNFNKTNKNQNTNLAQNLHTAGGILKMYDGDSVVEHGFNLFPEGLTIANQETGGGITTTTNQGTSFSFITDASGLDDNTITRLYIDQSDNVYAISSNSLNISTDAGATFTTVSTDDVQASEIIDIVANGSGNIYITTNSGLLRSEDNGATWERLESGSGKIVVSGYNYVTKRRSSFGLFGISQSNFYRVKEPFTKIVKTGLTTNQLQNAYIDNSGNLYVSSTIGVFVSTDGAETFDLLDKTDNLGSNSITDIKFGTTNTYIATSNGVAYTPDSGTTITNKTTSDGLGSNNINSIFVTSSEDIYAATQTGLSISTDLGVTYTNKTTSDGLDSDFIIQALVDSTGVIYALTRFGLNISTDSGTSFTPLSSDPRLSTINIQELQLDSNDNLYILSDAELVVTTDNGTTFTTIETELYKNQAMIDIALDSTDKLYSATGSGSLEQGQYQYVATYSWTDNRGNEHISAPSIPLTVTTTGTGKSNSAAIQIPMLRLTDKKNVIIDLYRTEVNGTIFYKETQSKLSVYNDKTADYTIISSSISDDDLINNELLYTTGGVLDNIAAPSCTIIESLNNRIFLGGLEDEHQIAFSKINSEGVPVEFSDVLTKQVPRVGGAVTGFKAMDDKLIIFKETAVYYLSGDGPNNLGEQDTFINIELLSSEIGCTNPESLVLTPYGVMFKSKKGIYLLSRSLQFGYIGAEVEQFNKLTVTSAEVIQNKNQVRFTTLEGECQVYDYYVQKWSTFTNHKSISATNLNEEYYYVRPDGEIYKENDESFTDAGSPIKLRIETDWIAFGGIQGYQRVYRALFLGSYKSPHKLRIRTAYNYIDSFIQEKIVDISDFTDDNRYGEDSPYGNPENTPYGGKGNLYQFRIDFKKQKCQSIKIRIEDIQTENIGEGYDLSNIFFMVGIKNSEFKPNQSNIKGTK